MHFLQPPSWKSSNETERERNENQEIEITKVSLFSSSGHSSIDTLFSLITSTSRSEMLENSQSLYNSISQASNILTSHGSWVAQMMQSKSLILPTTNGKCSIGPYI